MSGTSPRIDIIEAEAAFAASSISQSALLDSSPANLIAVPHTTIVNRAPIINLANDVGVRMGINRIMTQSVFELVNESGPNGEPVYGVVNDSLGQIRCVGTWVQGLSNNGIFLEQPGGFTDTSIYVEITWYGTGLNILLSYGQNGNAYSYSLDGGSPTAFNPGSLDAALTTRNTTPNQIVKVVSGLTQGIHTIKISKSSGNELTLCGVELINEVSSLTINPGSIFGLSRKGTLALQQSVAYNSGFETGSLGTKGGRVLTYLKSDNTIGKAANPAAASPSYLASASHTNEEVIRTIRWREFGAGRQADDFSSFYGTTALLAFALDDNTMILETNASSYGANDTLRITTTNDYLMIHFVGTGLDIQRIAEGTGTANVLTVRVDGTNVGNTTAYSVISGQAYWDKIVSGLPYGSHVVKFIKTATGSVDHSFSTFRLYQPATPSLPNNAIELGRYNVMANFVANATADIDTMSTGVLRKGVTREWLYSGGGSFSIQLDTANLVTGQDIEYSNTGVASYTFWGTGFDLRFQMQTNKSNSIIVAIDGTNYTGSATTYGGATWTPGTSTLNQNGTTQAGCGFIVSGLGLGIHTVSFTNTDGVNAADICTIDIITPIHSYKFNGPFSFQNTLMVGNQGISDSRVLNAIESKSLAQAVGVSFSPTTTSTSLVPMTDMNCTIKSKGGNLIVSYSVEGNTNTVGSGLFCQVFVDGVLQGQLKSFNTTTNGYDLIIADTIYVPTAAGAHNIVLHWDVISGTGTAFSTRRSINVREL